MPASSGTDADTTNPAIGEKLPPTQTQRTLSWWPGLLAALPLLLLALYPHASFRLSRGADWNGAVAHAHGDEVVYAAYLNAMIEGRPRRSDPYTGADRLEEGRHLPESYFSIQFVPPFALASVARLLGLSTGGAFLLLTVFCVLASTLAMHRLLSLLTGDTRASAFGALAVLCLGSAHLALGFFISGEASNNHLSFLRRYQPSAAFPLLFVFFALVWRIFEQRSRKSLTLYGAFAGMVFALLVFSYFYLWTTAAAWLFCLLICVGVARGFRGHLNLAALFVLMVMATSALVPYFWLLSQLSPSTEKGLLLTNTHAPDLFRVPELIGALTLLLLWFACRSRLLRGDSAAVLFTAAFAMTPFVVFNQQIVTGRSLQPFHYEMFTTNYVAVMGAVLLFILCLKEARNVPKLVARFLLPLLALAALASGTVETILAAKRFYPSNTLRDEAWPAFRRFAALGATSSDEKRAVVFVTSMTLADALPTIAPQSVYWAPHMINFPGVTYEEDRARLAAFLYLNGIDLSGVSHDNFQTLGGGTKYLVTSLIGRSRHNRHLTFEWKPVSSEEIRGALDYYAEMSKVFGERGLPGPFIDYVLTSDDERIDFSNLDRWYERAQGERFGRFTLYRVMPKPAAK